MRSVKLELLPEVEDCIATRLRLKVTYRALAARAGVTPKSITTMENGKVIPRLDTYLRIRKALDVIEAEWISGKFQIVSPRGGPRSKKTITKMAS